MSDISDVRSAVSVRPAISKRGEVYMSKAALPRE